jgi:hypothetical protein
MPHKTWAAGEDVLAADFNPNVANQIVAQYANAGARAAAWAAPPVGAVSALDDTLGQLWVWTGTQWVRADWRCAWGEMGYASVTAGGGNGSGNTPTDATGLTLTYTAVAGRRYKTTLHAHALSSIANDVQWFTICDAANAVKFALNAVNNSASFAEAVGGMFRETGLSAGAVTRKVRFYPPAGGGVMTWFADASRPSTLLIEDIGPSANPTALVDDGAGGLEVDPELLTEPYATAWAEAMAYVPVDPLTIDPEATPAALERLDTHG